MIIRKCIACEGTGKIGSYNNVICYECKGKGYIKSEWEEEFEDELRIDLVGSLLSEDYIVTFEKRDLIEIILKYFKILEEWDGMGKSREILFGKIKVKVRKGAILIERID